MIYERSKFAVGEMANTPQFSGKEPDSLLDTITNTHNSTNVVRSQQGAEMGAEV